MVAAGVDEPQRAYSRRYEVTRRLAAALPGSTSFRSGVTPEEMAAVYGDSRIVLNDGGDRHRPITMRVFEALGSGAALLTEDVPGLDLLLEPGVHYCILLPDAVEQVRTLLASEQLASLAAAGERFARGRHTYDHRVDELLRLFAATAAGSAPRRRIPADPIAAAVDADVDVQTVAVFGADLDLPDRAVYAEPAAAARVVRSQVDAVVVGDAGTDLEAALAGARRYVYATTAIAEAVRAALPNAGVTMRGDLVRFDLGAPGYRLR